MCYIVLNVRVVVLNVHVKSVHTAPRSVSKNRHIADSIDFMVEQVEKIERSTLASRLVIGTTKNYVEPQRLRHQPITIIDVFDDPGVSPAVQVRGGAGVKEPGRSL